MKLLVLISVLFAFAHADYDQYVAKKLEGYKFDISEEFAERFLKLVENEEHGLRASTAEVNEYVDKLLQNAQKFIIHQGLDPMNLPDISETLLITGQLNLTAGWLTGASTILRDGDVIVTYDRTKKYYTLDVPISFDALQFTYDWRARMLLITYDGGVLGKVSDLKIRFILGFDFQTFQASLDKFDITKSGTLTLKFSGNSLVDWLVNAMSGIVSTVLHPIIIRIIQAIVKGPLDAIVDLVNEIFNAILHPATETASYWSSKQTYYFQ